MPRILVVDDSKVVLSIVQTYLMQPHVEFDVASDAREALMKYQREPADLVVTDYLMPGMSGVELAEVLKMRSGGKVKIILISGQKDIKVSESLTAGTVDVFHPKPLDARKLQKAVEGLLRRISREQPMRRSMEFLRPRSVVIADDTRVGRESLERLVEIDPILMVSGKASDGFEAVEMAIEQRPTLVLLDAGIGGLDAMTVTRRIMERAPTRVIVLTEEGSTLDAKRAFESQTAGAVDALRRPRFTAAHGEEGEAFRDRLKELMDIPVIRLKPRPSQTLRPHRISHASLTPSGRPFIIGICSSTGGPAALAALLPRLAPALPHASVLVVQHVLAGFAQGLARFLSDKSGVRVRVGTHEERVRAGHVYLAPDEAHMRLTANYRLQVESGPPVGGHRPSGNALFESLARFDASSCAVILTGMGRDGVAGSSRLRRAGARVFVQSPDSCVVPGMSEAAIEEGIADQVGGVEELGDLLCQHVAEAVGG